MLVHSSEPSNLAHEPNLANEFRDSLRGVATTVTLISAEHGGRRYGMVATAVMSVSLAPTTLAVGVNRAASIHGAICQRNAFCVNVLSQAHEPISRHFASSSGEERFQAGSWLSLQEAEPVLRGIPYLADAQSAIFCRLRETVPCGSHSLFLGTVEQLLSHNNKSPLLYRDGGYGFFFPTSCLAENNRSQVS
jgi:flavin reductase (DIM6/NTAB) family NADH-FMN oxidoreductase RutF